VSERSGKGDSTTKNQSRKSVFGSDRQFRAVDDIDGRLVGSLRRAGRQQHRAEFEGNGHRPSKHAPTHANNLCGSLSTLCTLPRNFPVSLLIGSAGAAAAAGSGRKLPSSNRAARLRKRGERGEGGPWAGWKGGQAGYMCTKGRHLLIIFGQKCQQPTSHRIPPRNRHSARQCASPNPS
jgi:hypothetical protein